MTPIKPLLVALVFCLGATTILLAQPADSAFSAEVAAARASQDWHQFLTLHYQRAMQQAQSRNMPGAAEVLAAAMAEPNLPRDSMYFETRFLQGKVAGTLARYRESAPLYAEALALSDSLFGEENPYRVSLGNATAMAYASLGKRYLGISVMEKAITEARKRHGEQHMMTAELYNNLGLIHKSMGNLSTALGYYQRTFDIVSRLQPENYTVLGILDNNIGRVYFEMGDLEASKERIGEALLRDAKAPRPNASLYSSMGLTLMDLGEIDSARGSYEMALKLRTEQFGENSPRLAYYYQLLAEAQVATKEYDGAEESLKRAVALLDAEANPNLEDAVGVYLAYADLALQRGRYDVALERANEVFKLVFPEYDPAQPIANPEWEWTPQDYLSLVVVHVYAKKGEVLFARYQQDKELEDLRLAQENYSIMAELYQLNESFIFESRSQTLYSRKGREDWNRAVRSAAELYRQTDEPRYAAEAFALMESYKAARLQRRLEMAEGRGDILPDSVRARRDDLQHELVALEQKLYEARSANAENWEQLRDSLFVLQEQRATFVADVQETYPQFSNFMELGQGMTLEDFQAALPNEETLVLDYFVTGDEVVFLGITHNTVTVHEAKLPSPLHLPFTTDDVGGYAAYAKNIYDLLISSPLDVRESMGWKFTELVFLPDGPLFGVPFEVLVRQEVSPGLGFHELPYLLKDYVVRYHYSAQRLVMGGGDRLKPEVPALAVAPKFEVQVESLLATRSGDDSVRADRLMMLPYAEREAAAVARIYGGDLLTEGQATEAEVKRRVSRAKVVHLATHALVDADRPLYSKLVLAQDSTGEEDGLLHTYEIYQMKLAAELVTLSACNTGTGLYAEGEGVVSLAQGFLYAGAPNVMMSLWSVPDESTAKLMEGFYGHLRNGMSKSEALRQAKLDYLSEADQLTAAPYYWGGFLLVGELDEDQNLPIWVLILGAVVLVALGVTWYKRRS